MEERESEEKNPRFCGSRRKEEEGEIGRAHV